MLFPVMGMWFIVLQLFTGQVVMLPAGSEEECKTALKNLKVTNHVVTLDNGLMLPVDRGIECISPEDAARRQGNL